MRLLSIFLALAATPAWAQEGGNSTLLSLLPLVFIFVIMYFLLIRPQQKRAKEHREMTGQIKKGDEVMTSGGLCGRVQQVHDSFVELRIAPQVVVQLQRSSIASLLPPDSLLQSGRGGAANGHGEHSSSQSRNRSRNTNRRKPPAQRERRPQQSREPSREPRSAQHQEPPQESQSSTSQPQPQSQPAPEKPEQAQEKRSDS